MKNNKKRLPLATQIILGIVLGIVWSIFSIKFGWNQLTIDWIKPFGDIFIKLLKLVAIPLVLFSPRKSWRNHGNSRTWSINRHCHSVKF